MSWPMTCLGEVASLERKSLLPEEIETGTSYLGLEHIESGGRILGYQRVGAGELQSNKFMFDQGTLLYGKLRPYLAKICIPDREGCCSTDILPIRPSQKLDISYLKHVLLWKPYVDKANSLCSGANLPRISPSSLLGIEIPLSPLEEQRRIAAILDKADQLLGQSRLLIKEVPSVEQSIFESLFGEFVNGSSAYPVKALEEIVKENRIGLVRASTECGSDLPYAYLKMDAIGKNGRLLLHKAIKTRASSEELAAYSVRDGDVLFNTRNSRELVGKTAVYRGADEMLFNNNLMRLRFNPSTVSPDFFRLFLGSRQGASELESRKSGTTSVCAIYWKNLKTMPVPLPPYELQFQLAKSLENLERLTKKYFRQEAHCNDLSKVLKSDLMSGSH